MKMLIDLASMQGDLISNRYRTDGKLKDRLETLDQNIKMFSKPMYANNPSVQAQLAELKQWRALFIDFYDGKIGFLDIPYPAWELTTGIPDWGTRGT